MTEAKIQALLTRWLMEWGTNWASWSDDQFEVSWYQDWCVDHGVSTGVENDSRVSKYLVVDRNRLRMRIGKKGLKLISGTPESSGVQQKAGVASEKGEEDAV